MGRSLKKNIGAGLEAVDALYRVLLAGDSPGVKMAAGFALESLLKVGISGRPVPVSKDLKIAFAVSVTVLSDDMERVLMKKAKRGGILPRRSVESQMTESFIDVARELALETTGDHTSEVVLWGRALSIEIWDDFEDELQIGFNFLVISRHTPDLDEDYAWEFVNFSRLNLNNLDPREALALSEMLTIMGVQNPYDGLNEVDLKFPAA